MCTGLVEAQKIFESLVSATVAPQWAYERVSAGLDYGRRTVEEQTGRHTPQRSQVDLSLAAVATDNDVQGSSRATTRRERSVALPQYRREASGALQFRCCV